MARTLIGNIKGPKGDTGDTGATGATGAAGASASVSVGTVTALEYGNDPTVTNSGSAQNAVFNFGIPKGKPADNITELDNLPVNSSVTPSADFPVPAVGDTSKTILGKIIKWFGDMSALVADMSALVATKFNAANVVNNLTTTASGYALDARQGKALHDENYYSSGDTIVLNDATYAGMSNASGNSISLFIPVPKQVNSRLNVSVNSVTINWVRADGQTYQGMLAVTQGVAGNINTPGTLGISVDGTFPTVKMMGVNLRATFTVM